MLSFIDHTRVGQPPNQGNSHREARLSGRMPQIAPRRFAVGANADGEGIINAELNKNIGAVTFGETEKSQEDNKNQQNIK